MTKSELPTTFSSVYPTISSSQQLCMIPSIFHTIFQRHFLHHHPNQPLILHHRHPIPLIRKINRPRPQLIQMLLYHLLLRPNLLPIVLLRRIPLLQLHIIITPLIMNNPIPPSRMLPQPFYIRSFTTKRLGDPHFRFELEIMLIYPKLLRLKQHFSHDLSAFLVIKRQLLDRFVNA